MDSRPLAFVIDDEPAMLDIVTFALETQGFRTESFQSAEHAWVALERTVPDLVVLDIVLPDVTGLTLCRRIKARWGVPVMLVTAKTEASDRIAGLEADADDYIGKPFHPRELALRAQRLVRRITDGGPLECGPIRLDLASHQGYVEGVPLSLTSNEFKLLAALLSANGQVVDYAHLLLVAWGETGRRGEREMIKAAVYRLRHKLDDALPGCGGIIESVRSRGYLLRTPDVSP